jgi:hypothetical protein
VRTHSVHGGIVRLETAVCWRQRQPRPLCDVHRKIDLTNAAYRGGPTVRNHPKPGIASVACPPMPSFGCFCGIVWSPISNFHKARVDFCEPAHNIYLCGSSATSRLITALASYGSEVERSEPRQIFRA